MQNKPQCIFESKADELTLAIEFHCRHGRIHGFPYGHLLNYLSDRNPDAQPKAPADRFSLWFSTHDVILLGWRLKGIASLLQRGLLASVHAVDAKYYGLSEKEEPYVSEIIVTPAQREAA